MKSAGGEQKSRVSWRCRCCCWRPELASGSDPKGRFGRNRRRGRRIDSWFQPPTGRPPAPPRTGSCPRAAWGASAAASAPSAHGWNQVSGSSACRTAATRRGFTLLRAALSDGTVASGGRRTRRSSAMLLRKLLLLSDSSSSTSSAERKAESLLRVRLRSHDLPPPAERAPLTASPRTNVTLPALGTSTPTEPLSVSRRLDFVSVCQPGQKAASTAP